MLIAQAPTPDEAVPTGLPIGEVRWGAQLCPYYLSERDLAQIIVPFVVAGLAHHERCVWLAARPFGADQAHRALAAVIPDLDDVVRRRQLLIVDASESGSSAESSVPRAWTHDQWIECARQAVSDGYRGLRIAGTASWLRAAPLDGERIVTLCGRELDRTVLDDAVDSVRAQGWVMVRGHDRWHRLASATAALALSVDRAPDRGPDRPPATRIHTVEFFERGAYPAGPIVEGESTRRAALDTVLDGAQLTERRLREHLVILQRITSALSEAVTHDDLGRVVTSDLALALGATVSLLALGHELIALRGATTPDEPERLATDLATLPDRWTTAPNHPLELRWLGCELVRVVPLAIADRRHGTLVLGFHGKSVELTPEQRALVDDIARQLAIAVDRAAVYELARRERARAEAANVAKDQFLAMLGHELRNPLSPILTATQLMRLRAPDALERERSTIERSVTQMMRLVDDLLDVAKLTHGKIALVRSPCEVAEVVAHALELSSAAIEERGHRVHVNVEPGLMIDVDRARMAQVFSKLIGNAAKFTRHGGTIELTAALAADDKVELSVIDDGAGIAPDLLPHVFELFVQSPQGSDRAKGGLGVGLAIARAFIELHDGTISVSSAGAAASTGDGTRFTVSLPRWSPPPSSDSSRAEAVGTGRRVLVVDDNEDAAWLLAEALRLAGHVVEVRHDGVDALDIVRTFAPEIAFLDIGLPGMDGYTLCRKLCELPARPKLVAVTGYGQVADRERALAAGFDLHFVKPVSLREVHDAIESFERES
jgi:signal transduction histidine kinase